MKVPSCLAIALLICVEQISSQAWEKRPDLPGKPDQPRLDITPLRTSIRDRQKFVEMLNNYRKQVAEMENIGNMHELSWSSELETKLEVMTCKDMKPGSDYFSTPAPNFEMIHLHWIREATPTGKDSVLMGMLALFLEPMQTKIGCAQLKMKCPGGDFEYKEACLLGPKNAVEGHTPGTKCPGGKAPSGLCVASVAIKSEISAMIFIYTTFACMIFF